MRGILDGFGQLFVMAFDGRRPSVESLEFFARFQIGGIILFEDNYEEVARMRMLIEELQSRCASPEAPLLVLADHEGGRVQRFRDGFSQLPAAAELGRDGPDATAHAYATAAHELQAAGVNVDLAPVADLCPPDQPGTIGDRSFGVDPARVAEHVAAAVRALQAGGVAACVKHFPGHGATTHDAHRELPVVDLDAEELRARDFVPFRAALHAGVAAVMTGHVLYPAAGDPESPASLSKHWIDEVLRRELGFDGVVVSDALEMKGLTSRFDPVESGGLALAAGTDLVLYYKEADQYEAFFELLRSLERRELDPKSVARSIQRVRALKHRVRELGAHSRAGACAPLQRPD
jgi:beta-N-acetylhexosaminidase